MRDLDGKDGPAIIEFTHGNNLVERDSGSNVRICGELELLVGTDRGGPRGMAFNGGVWDAGEHLDSFGLTPKSNQVRLSQDQELSSLSEHVTPSCQNFSILKNLVPQQALHAHVTIFQQGRSFGI